MATLTAKCGNKYDEPKYKLKIYIMWNVNFIGLMPHIYVILL